MREDGADGVLDDVFDDVIGGVVAAGGFALAAVVFEIDFAARVGAVGSVLATTIFEDGEFLLSGLGIGDDEFHVFFVFDKRHLYGGDAQFEFEQAFVDAAKLADAETFVVNEGEVVAFVVEVAGHAVEAESEGAVGYFVCGEETGGLHLWRVVAHVGLSDEEATVVDGDVEVGIAFVYGME